jgi:murein DD-endopeptidase MepM/ murein hydrolase activator NlpD
MMIFVQQLKDFFLFLKEYFSKKALDFGKGFEKFKDVIVAVLIVKRGKYSSSFLNTSFIILVIASVVGGPIIAENNPFLGVVEQRAGNYQAAVVSYNPYESSLSTIISAKPRDKVVDYEVKSGDTLASVASKFNVSVDSIKWATNIKTDTIKTGTVLKIPPITGVVYKVVSGDNIYSIAKKYRTDAQKIVNFPFNDFVDLDTFALVPGQTLFVPDGVPPVEQPRITSPYIAQIQAGVQGSSTFIWPTSGSISQYPVWYHMAVDIQNPSAPSVIASDTGTVVFAGCLDWGYGCHIIINHGNGYESLYGHLSNIAVSPGQAVSQGQTIGIMGSTGRSTGTHLHFEVRSGGGLLNPLNFLQ